MVKLRVGVHLPQFKRLVFKKCAQSLPGTARGGPAANLWKSSLSTQHLRGGPDAISFKENGTISKFQNVRAKMAKQEQQKNRRSKGQRMVKLRVEVHLPQFKRKNRSCENLSTTRRTKLIVSTQLESSRFEFLESKKYY
jgi:hypothetical protein